MKHILAKFQAHKLIDSKYVVFCLVASFGSNSAMCSISWQRVFVASVRGIFFDVISIPCHNMLYTASICFTRLCFSSKVGYTFSVSIPEKHFIDAVIGSLLT